MKKTANSYSGRGRHSLNHLGDFTPGSSPAVISLQELVDRLKKAGQERMLQIPETKWTDWRIYQALSRREENPFDDPTPDDNVVFHFDNVYRPISEVLGTYIQKWPVADVTKALERSFFRKPVPPDASTKSVAYLADPLPRTHECFIDPYQYSLKCVCEPERAIIIRARPAPDTGFDGLRLDRYFMDEPILNTGYARDLQEAAKYYGSHVLVEPYSPLPPVFKKKRKAGETFAHQKRLLLKWIFEVPGFKTFQKKQNFITRLKGNYARTRNKEKYEQRTRRNTKGTQYGQQIRRVNQ